MKILTGVFMLYVYKFAFLMLYCFPTICPFLWLVELSHTISFSTFLRTQWSPLPFCVTWCSPVQVVFSHQVCPLGVLSSLLAGLTNQPGLRISSLSMGESVYSSRYQRGRHSLRKMFFGCILRLVGSKFPDQDLNEPWPLAVKQES